MNERSVHGALDYTELTKLGLKPEELLDFSVNSNPYGASPLVRAAIANASIERYPDRECLQLRHTILEYELADLNVPLASIVCGNGTSELIWAIAHTYLRAGTNVAIIGPTFGEYHAASRAAGASINEFRAPVEANFQIDSVALTDWLQVNRPALVWLCNPNNPTGTYLSKELILLIVEKCKQIGALLVIDESYTHFVQPYEIFSAIEALTVVDPRLQLFVMRSLTKDFALAGLRLGYVVGAPASMQRFQRQLPAWNVGGIAQVAGYVALADRLHLATTLERLAAECVEFVQAVQRSGFSIIPSRTHFFLLEVGDAQQARERLLYRKILIRDCTSFDLPSFIRVATRPAYEWRQLLKALEEDLC